jgi:UbiD family decarboxylase
MDLRTLIEKLAAQDELLTVQKEVDPRFELAAVVSKIQKGENKAVLFERVKGSQLPVLANLFGTYGRVGLVMGCTKREVVRVIGEKLRETPFVKAASKRGRKTVDVTELGQQLPIATHYEKDAGPYITGGVILAKDPDTGIHNLSYHRMQWTGGGELRFRITPGHHLGIYFEKAERENRNLDAVVLIGAPPAVMLSAAFGLPYDWDELQVAGTLQGNPVELTACETVALEIPSDTSIAIEGQILHHVRKPEGPYGDWQGNYIPVTENHVFQAKTITLGSDPFYYTMFSGSPEDVVLIGMPVAVSMYRNVKTVVPTVADAACWPFLFYGVVQIKKKAKGQGKKAALAALGTDMEWMKYVIVVDEDVDIYRPEDVLWAMATRCSPERDIITIPGVPSFSRDPHRMHWGRVIFDATVPFGLEKEFERKKVPMEDQIRIEDYL